MPENFSLSAGIPRYRLAAGDSDFPGGVAVTKKNRIA